MAVPVLLADLAWLGLLAQPGGSFGLLALLAAILYGAPVLLAGLLQPLLVLRLQTDMVRELGVIQRCLAALLVAWDPQTVYMVGLIGLACLKLPLS